MSSASVLLFSMGLYFNQNAQWKPFSLNTIHDVTCHELDLESGQFGDPFAASVFKVSQCMSRWHCGQGYFLVQRRDEELCKRMLRKDGKMRKVIFDDELNRKLVEDVGPDFFYLVFDGPARVAPMTWTHAGNCKTRHPFHLVNPGNYTVSLEWTHTNFSAVNEIDLKGIHPSPVARVAMC
ncbi:hypothetical protein BCR33DRAFT_128063 [Rhizoclosmatium globosum]|uniref:Uncharacterized protein n=1 Tax=Rhizoclosmatium globosum TaxID=329046 RepID=A0A1Y2CHL5_9FUNG|nr:hypothetical protein BCR33DRAFT_128063 [Rhizoclosmatium globosum]|eukprot:ORY46407.1 hypothetical protein BCR33DRAFT_128063 [Rhizoclosmatium globosum]